MASFVLNLMTKELSPVPSVQGMDPRDAVSEHTILVTTEQAREIGQATMVEREQIVARILGKKLVADGDLPVEHRKILSAGMDALGIDEVGELETESAKVEAETDKTEPAEEEPISMDLDTGSAMALMTRDQLRKMKSQARLVRYAREMLGLEVADNEKFDSLKRRVFAMQFGDPA